MKKLVMYVLVILVSVPALAQKTENFFDQLTNKYSDKDGFSASMITKDMFDLYLKKKNVDSESAVFGAIKNLEKIMIISQSNLSSGYLIVGGAAEDKPEKPEKTQDNELLETILAHYKTGDYTLLKTEKRMGEELKVYLKKNQDKVESLALVTNSNAATNLIELQGDINLTAVADLSSAFNLRGLENLNKINNSGTRTIWGQNNGAYYIPDNYDELIVRQREQFDRQRVLTEEQRAKIQVQARLSAEKQVEYAEKYRELAEKYRRQPIFLNYPGDSTIYYLNGKKVDAEEIKNIDKESIKSIEVNKPEKETDKTTIKIKTK